MTWKKLVAGTTSGALAVWMMASLTDCTVCSGPNCVSGGDGGTGDAAKEGGGGEGGVDAGPTCSAVKPQGPLYWDNMMGTGPCDKCMAAMCCPAAQACANQMGGDGSMDTCVEYLNCLDNCVLPDGGTDQSCVNACDQLHPSGKMVASSLVSCLQTKCPNDCK